MRYDGAVKETPLHARRDEGKAVEVDDTVQAIIDQKPMSDVSKESEEALEVEGQYMMYRNKGHKVRFEWTYCRAYYRCK
jgi:hypothetical protein